MKIRDYLYWAGWLILLITVLVSYLSGLYEERGICSEFEGKFIHPLAKPVDGSSDSIRYALYEHYNAKFKRCTDVTSNIYISYSLITLGVAFIVGGYIIKR